MKLLRKARKEIDPDLVAFADVAFLLIIFFILTTTFVSNRGQVLELPSASEDPEQLESELLTISLTSQHMLLNGRDPVADIAALRTYLQAQQLPQREDTERMVWIESAPDVRCDRYYQVVAVVTDAGGILALVEEEARE